MRRALITGGAGFIGSQLSAKLLAEGWEVAVVDNFDDYYERSTKLENVRSQVTHARYSLLEVDIRNRRALARQIRGHFDVIIHLAARCGVRPSIVDAVTYQSVNVAGTQNLLELAKERDVKQFVFASSSSVYGLNPQVPWMESDAVLLPISPYASTKVSAELMGHVYSHLYGIRFIALRLFTVYGPRQRPDLAIHQFTRRMLEGRSIPVYGKGDTRRDYTFIGDILDGFRAAIDYRESAFEVFNLGHDRTVTLLELIGALEEVLSVRARIEYLPEQAGDVPQTWANIAKARRLLNYRPSTRLDEGLRSFADWYVERRSAPPALPLPARGLDLSVRRSTQLFHEAVR